MKYCGIDLHSNNSVVVITDETDRVGYSKRLPNDLTQVLRALEMHRTELCGVVVESTYNSYWLVDGLQEVGHRVHLANTAAIKQYDGLKHRGDEADARQLAQLLRLGLLPEGHIMPKEARAVRDLARKRMQLVQQRTAQILSIESSLSRYTGGRISSNSIKRLQEADVAKMSVSEMQALGIKANVAVMRSLEAQIDSLEKVLAKYCRTEPGYRLLKTVEGIGEVLATVILLETGDIERFPDVGNYASYCRCVGSQHESNGKKKGEGNTKNGNRYLAWAFVEAANFAVRYCEPARRFYQKKKAKRNGTLAIKAVAHKLARACYHMLKKKEAFSVERCFA
ncbi:MAG: IS110 family transposase [Roseiflexaceae bacterium]|nr:IS110 family transposase [Roseiflexaceae bacterium]